MMILRLVLRASPPLAWRCTHLKVLLLLCALPLLAGCRRPPESEGLAGPNGTPAREVWGVSFAVLNDGMLRAKISAPFMADIETPDSTYTLLTSAAGDSAAPVLVVVYDEEGQTAATIRADTLILPADADRYVARGDVRVESAAGKRLEGDHLVWVERDRQVSTPHFVRIITPTERIQGYELQADENLDTYTIARVTGMVIVEEEE